MAATWALHVPRVQKPTITEQLALYTPSTEHPNKLWIHEGVESIPVVLQTNEGPLFILFRYQKGKNVQRGIIWQLEGALEYMKMKTDLSTYKLIAMDNDDKGIVMTKNLCLDAWVTNPKLKNYPVLLLTKE